jgi:hypothetical protein
MCSHVPDKSEQMVRYRACLWLSYYSNVSRGRRRKEKQDGVIPYIIEPEENSKGYRRNWVMRQGGS